MSNATKAATGLSPHPGSNPARRPAPKSPDLEFFQGQNIIHPELCYIVSQAVGHGVTIEERRKMAGEFERLVKSFCGFSGPAFQVMRWDEGPGPGREFWRWYLWERPQWYSTPEEACAAYVAGYAEWIQENPEKP